MKQESVRPAGAALVMLALLAGLWLLEVVDLLAGGALDGYGIEARELDGLPGVFAAPFLHAGFGHLVSNSVPFAVLGFLVLLGGATRWLLSSLTSVVSSGLFAWLLTPAGTIVLGASGLVFGWLTYLVVRGVWSRRPAQVLVGLAVLLVYGGMIWGVLPGAAGISWQAHLGGAVGGGLAAWWLHRRTPVAVASRRGGQTSSR